MVHSELVKLILIDDNVLRLLDLHASDVNDKFKAISTQYKATLMNLFLRGRSPVTPSWAGTTMNLSLRKRTINLFQRRETEITAIVSKRLFKYG